MVMKRSYEPRRYSCNYSFHATIYVDSPWFDEIQLEISDGRKPDSPYTDLYREYEHRMLSWQIFCKEEITTTAFGTATVWHTAQTPVTVNLCRMDTEMQANSATAQRNRGILNRRSKGIPERSNRAMPMLHSLPYRRQRPVRFGYVLLAVRRITENSAKTAVDRSRLHLWVAPVAVGVL